MREIRMSGSVGRGLRPPYPILAVLIRTFVNDLCVWHLMSPYTPHGEPGLFRFLHSPLVVLIGLVARMKAPAIMPSACYQSSWREGGG